MDAADIEPVEQGAGQHGDLQGRSAGGLHNRPTALCVYRMKHSKNEDGRANDAQMPCTCGLVLQISMGRAEMCRGPVNIRDFNHTCMSISKYL